MFYQLNRKYDELPVTMQEERGKGSPVKKTSLRISKCTLGDQQGVEKCAQQHIRGGSIMTRNSLWRLAVFAGWAILSKSVAHAAGDVARTDPQLLSEDRILPRTVDEDRGDHVRLNTGKGKPRFLPMGVRKDRGLPEREKGNWIDSTVNGHNLLGDVHRPSEVNHHHVVVGQLVGPMETGHDNAVIRTKDGKEVSHLVRPFARSKVTSISIGIDIIFLIDGFHKIVDVAMGSVEPVPRATALEQQKSPPKSDLQHLRIAELELGKDPALSDVCRKFGVTEETYYRWKKEYGGLHVDQAKHLKALEQENLRLKQIVANQALDLSILKEVAPENF